jgi:ribosomal protein S18 acetylase RimI-like enzyme
MKIRRMKSMEIPKIITLHRESIVPLWKKLKRKYNLKDIENYLKKNFSKEKMFVIEEGNKIIACGSIAIKNSLKDKEAEIGMILVSKSYQREGYGKAIISFLEEYAKRKKIKELKLDVLIDNPAVKFYEHQGYKKYKFIMRKVL